MKKLIIGCFLVLFVWHIIVMIITFFVVRNTLMQKGETNGFCGLNPFTNELSYCTTIGWFCESRSSLKYAGGFMLLDLYNLIFPLTIKVCL